MLFHVSFENAIDDFGAYLLAELFYKNPKNIRTRIVDKKVNTGWTAIDSHINYWNDDEVAKLIADILSDDGDRQRFNGLGSP